MPEPLLELAQQSAWFRKSRFKGGQGRKPNVGGRGLGYSDKTSATGLTGANAIAVTSRPNLVFIVILLYHNGTPFLTLVYFNSKEDQLHTLRLVGSRPRQDRVEVGLRV